MKDEYLLLILVPLLLLSICLMVSDSADVQEDSAAVVAPEECLICGQPEVLPLIEYWGQDHN